MEEVALNNVEQKLKDLKEKRRLLKARINKLKSQAQDLKKRLGATDPKWLQCVGCDNYFHNTDLHPSYFEGDGLRCVKCDDRGNYYG